MSKSFSLPGAPAGRHRPCPALQQPITTSDCGARRNSQISCPATCPHNPLGIENYDVYLQLEGRFSNKLLQRITASFSRDVFRRCLRELSADPHGENLDAMEIFLGANQVMNGPRDARGRSGWEAWEADNWVGLNNDERLMARYWPRGDGMVLEVQEVVNDYSCWAIDVLSADARPIRVFDRSLSRAVVPYDRFLCVATHFIHFTRPLGIVAKIPWHLWSQFDAELKGWLEEERPSNPSLTRGRLIRQHFFQVQELLHDLGEQWRRNFLRSADVHHGVATYRLAVPRAEIVGILRQRADFEEQENPQASPPLPRPDFHFRWLRRGESQELERELPTAFQHSPTGERGWGMLGDVRVYEDRVVVESVKRQYFDFTKAKMAQYFGERLILERESLTDLAKQVLEHEDNAEVEAAYREAQAMESEPTNLVVSQLSYGRKHYSGSLRDLLGRHPEMIEPLEGVDPESAGKGVLAEFQIVDLGAPCEAHLGRVKVLQDEVQVTCFGEERAEAADAIFRRCFGQELSLRGRRNTDLRPWLEELTAKERAFRSALDRALARGARLPEPEEFGLPEDFFDHDESARDASFEQVRESVSGSDLSDGEAISPDEKQRLLEEFHQSHYRRMMDDTIPMLRGHSPREAARDPSLRPLLLDWMKLHLNELAHRKRDEGLDIRIDWMLDELELPELKHKRLDRPSDFPSSGI